MRGPVKTLLGFACVLLVTSAFGLTGLTIKTQPKSISINAGSTAAFSVTTTNGTVTGYQWYLGTTALQDGVTTNGATISGSQTATLTIENVGTNLNAKLFKVAISNNAALAFSIAAKLTVLQGTLVKFDTAQGQIIVELFDHDKPVTVQDFLCYAVARPNPLYLNTFFSRLEKNFVLQGGGYAPIATSAADAFTNEFNIPDVYYSSAFNSQPGVPGYIVNESQIGPHVHNTFGTIAMATISGFPDGFPNTARSEFFFNLADNTSGATNLDTINGGYTVFGRVVQGSNVLASFNNLPSEQILSYTVPNGYGSLGSKNFPTLPTKTNDAGNVHVSDLYFAGISVLGRPFLDLTRPTGKITYPLANARLTNGDFTLHGIAIDKTGISSVICTKCVYFSIGPDPLSDDITRIVNVTGTTNWSADMHLHPGPWSLTFRIIDGFGNWTQISENINVMDPLTVQKTGLGNVIPNYNGQFLAPETKYSMTAIPNKGQLFAYWSGVRNGQPWNFPYGAWTYVNVLTNGTNSLVLSGPALGYRVPTPILSFTMYSNLTIYANFVSNYFPVVQGTYYGLIAPPDHDDITVSNSGLCKITSTATGSFTGNLSLQNTLLPFGGKWDYAGNANISIPRRGNTPLSVSLSIDLSNNLGTITGTVSNASWMSDIQTYRQVTTKLSTNTVPAMRSYIMTFPTQPANSDLGDSFATVSVSSLGLLTIAGTMSDNTTWTESAGVSKDGKFPLFASLYSGHGLVIGLEDFTSTSVARWIRPAISNAYYTNGFNTGAFINGLTPFSRPATNIQFALQFGGNTLSQQSYVIQATKTGQFGINGNAGNRLKILLTPTTGALNGSWLDATNGLWTLKGVFINNDVGGTGFILGPHGKTGYLRIVPPV